MSTIRLTPRAYYLSSTNYLSVSNEYNMYNNTDNDTYATITNSRTQTTSYYIYLRDFDFGLIPNGAVINSFTIKLKARQSGVSTSTSYKPYLANGTSAINGTCDVITTTAQVLTFTGISANWETISGYGDEFGIRINCRRASRNTTGYVYIYGAEILVDYTVPDPRTVVSSLNGNGTISPNGTITTYDGEEYQLTITPTNKSDTVTATKDGVDITSELVAHGSGQTLTIVPDDVTTSGISSGSSYAEYAVGHSAESPSSSGSSSNMYASSGSTGHADYTFDFSSIPANATIENVTIRCYGHRENATVDSSHVSNVAAYVNGVKRGLDVDFPSTSNSIISLVNLGLSREDLDNIVVRHTVGYYGGLVLGISFEVTYSVGSGIDHYTYTYTVNGDSNIVVNIGSSPVTGNKIYIKSSNTWKQSTKVYVKINNTWREVNKVYSKQTNAWSEEQDKSAMFNNNAIYKKGN